MRAKAEYWGKVRQLEVIPHGGNYRIVALEIAEEGMVPITDYADDDNYIGFQDFLEPDEIIEFLD